MSAHPTPAPGGHESGRAKSWPRWAWDGVADLTGINHNDDRNVHAHYHGETHKRDVIREQVTEIADLAARRLNPAADAVNARLATDGAILVGDLRNAQITWGQALAALEGGDDSQMDNARRELRSALLPIRDGNAMWNNVAAGDRDILTISAAADQLIQQLDTVCFDPSGAPILNGRGEPEAQRNLRANLQNQTQRAQNLVTTGRAAPAGATNVIVAATPDGEEFAEFQQNALELLNSILTASYWNTTPVMPGSPQVLAAATTARTAVRDMVTVEGPNLRIGDRGAAMRAMQDLLVLLDTHLRTAPAHGAQIAERHPDYTWWKRFRQRVAAILLLTGAGDATLNDADLIKKPFRGAEYVARNTIGGEEFLNPYANYNMEELEQAWVKTAGENGELLDGGQANVKKLSRLERVAAERVLNRADIKKISNARFKKAVEEKLAKIKAEGKQSETKAAATGEANPAAAKAKESPDMDMGKGFKSKRIGNKLLITVPKGNVYRAQYAVWIGKPNERSNRFTGDVSVKSETLVEMDIPAEFADLPTFGIAIGTPKGGTDWDNPEFTSSARFDK